VIALAVPASAFIHVRVLGDDCSGFGPESAATGAITSQSRPGNLFPLDDHALHDSAPNDFCPPPAQLQEANDACVKIAGRQCGRGRRHH
jgi:hypothetical protein